MAYVTDHSKDYDPVFGDYIALLKPRVMSLVVFTAFVGLMAAPGTLHPIEIFCAVLFIALGAGASGSLNMWWDSDIDAIMHRTKTRPIPSGRTSRDAALGLGVALSGLSILMLGLASNWHAAGWLAFTIFFYAVVYTIWLKRMTPQNIVIGGAAGAFPPVIGWISATGDLNAFEPWLLFSIIFLWTPSHFWALALYRSKDYALTKIPMLPVTAGIKHTKYQIVIYAVLLVVSSFSVLLAKDLSFFYLSAASVLGSVYLYLAGRLFVSDQPAHSMRLFGYSIFYLFALFTFLILDVLFV
jgi:protoheme IX farnesyltransferase